MHVYQTRISLKPRSANIALNQRRETVSCCLTLRGDSKRVLALGWRKHVLSPDSLLSVHLAITHIQARSASEWAIESSKPTRWRVELVQNRSLAHTGLYLSLSASAIAHTRVLNLWIRSAWLSLRIAAPILSADQRLAECFFSAESAFDSLWPKFATASSIDGFAARTCNRTKKHYARHVSRLYGDVLCGVFLVCLGSLGY